MTSLTLTKHHGLGNDFLVVFEPPIDDLAAFARARVRPPPWGGGRRPPGR